MEDLERIRALFETLERRESVLNLLDALAALRVFRYLLVPKIIYLKMLAVL